MSVINKKIMESKRRSKLPENRIKSSKEITFGLLGVSLFYWFIGIFVYPSDDIFSSLSNGWGLTFAILSIISTIKYFYLKRKYRAYLETLQLAKIAKHVGVHRFV